MRAQQSYHRLGGELVLEQVLHDEEGGEQLLQLDWEGGGELLALDVLISGGVLAEDPLDKHGEEREEGGAGRDRGFLKLQPGLGQQLPLKGMLCEVQLEPCHDLSAWLLSSSYVGLGGDHHGSHGDGHGHLV